VVSTEVFTKARLTQVAMSPPGVIHGLGWENGAAHCVDHFLCHPGRIIDSDRDRDRKQGGGSLSAPPPHGAVPRWEMDISCAFLGLVWCTPLHVSISWKYL
jgi:hypothetical protein